MKKLYLVGVILTLLFAAACSSDIPEDTSVGSIAGSVSDRTTGEPVSTVTVSLTPGGSSTVTGSDGSFSFNKLEPGKYTISISKEGYKSTTVSANVKGGAPTSVHMTIDRIPGVVTADRTKLDFGDNQSLNTLSFNIVNSSYEDLNWEIENRCDWITEIKPEKGILKYGKTEAIVVVIDRELLAAGTNEAVIVVRSSNGSSDVKVTAVGAERVLPSLNTLEPIDITSTTATIRGEILDAGVPAYTERGFVYSLNAMPTFDNMIAKLTATVNEEAQYSYALKGLTLGEKYYVRAYAINNVGTAYSTNEVEFSTVMQSPKLSIKNVTDISPTTASATFNASVVSVGDPEYFERGFCFSLNSNPTINNTKVKANGTGIGDFSVNVTDLKLNQKYYVRAYAISKIKESEQVIYTSEEVSFTITSKVPQIKTLEVTNINIANGLAVFNGSIESAGEPKYSEKGFVYGKLVNPTVNDLQVSVLGSGLGQYSTNINNLQEGNVYYVRAYAVHLSEVIYGENVTFDFVAKSPTVSTQQVTNINVGNGSAVFNGTLISKGDLTIKEKGFVYSLTRNPTINDYKITVNGTTLGAYSVTAKNLSVGNTYYVRAYVLNDKEVVYGEEVMFDFKATAAEVESLYLLNIDENTIAAYGELISTGDPIITEKGFVYSTYPTPTLDDANVDKISVIGNSKGKFVVNITNLVANNRYYIRPYAKNLAGVSYGSIKSIVAEQPKYVLVGDNLLVMKEDVSPTDISWESANNASKGTSVGGFNDWRLPTSEEAVILFQNRKNIGGFAENEVVDEYVTGSVEKINGINYYKSYYNKTQKEYFYWTSSSPSYQMMNFTTGEVKRYGNGTVPNDTYYIGSYGPNKGTSQNYEKYYRDVKSYNFRARAVRSLE